MRVVVLELMMLLSISRKAVDEYIFYIAEATVLCKRTVSVKPQQEIGSDSECV